MNDVQQLAEDIVRGDIRSLARGITLVENGLEAGFELLRATSRLGRQAAPVVIGITGLPGAGKSTLLDHLIDRFRLPGSKVGVIVVDPSSPVHGGALLGDRARLMRHATSQEVIIRSMASRGSLGGLNAAIGGVIQLMASAGCRPIFVETVGMGQVGWDIASVAGVVVAVTAPNLGDETQMMKAGILDLVDVVVLNKSDLPGVDATLAALKNEMEHRHLELVLTCASTGEGVSALVQFLERSLRDPETGAGANLQRHRERNVAEIVERALALARPLLTARMQRLELEVSEAPEAAARRLFHECFGPVPDVIKDSVLR